MLKQLFFLLQVFLSVTSLQISPQVNLGPVYQAKQAKLKVDKLGSLLKKHVTKLRSVPLYEVDLVFLVDSSASVGADNFYNEIKFIRKLLADFTVSYNSTRVVIITYSSVNQVIRQVDHMSVPVVDKHKCSLFEAEIPAITYNSGGTYTLGALIEAQDVFRFSRDSAKKAVFLITDGYSNGGDPRPAAEKLKRQGVEFYTFGIRNGNVKELFDMASEPRNEHSFIVNSFEEFEALARRALHKDLGGSVYLKQDPGRCSNLCQGGECCDEVASCSCGAHSGFYSCICPRGFFGRGLKGDCKKCPGGTYKPRLDPGDRRSCIPCPEENQISPPGSYSALQCYCKEGFTLRNGKCTMMDCAPLQPPPNGYFIRNECANVFNAACGVKCNSGFALAGSSIRLCLPTGEWSGEPAVCRVKTCRKLMPPGNGFVTCNTTTHEVDTSCQFGCEYGYRLIGSRKRTCLPISLWGGLPAYCKRIKCSRLRKPNYGLIAPEHCSERKQLLGAQCAFACKAGFRLQGASIRECGERSAWNGGPYLSRCRDVRAPNLQCPKNMTVSADKHSYHTRVAWKDPVTEDNSGYRPLVGSVPAVSSPARFKIGANIIKYISEDLSGNKNTCIFEIRVVDVEPPVVDFCESPPEFITDTEDVEIEWDEPIFHDNSRDQLEIVKSHGFGFFKFGSTEVKYTATDSSGNQATCEMTITLKEHSCSEPTDPINGHKDCREDDLAVQCTLACDEGFAFAFKPTGDYFCERAGVGDWLPENNVLPFPDCSVTALSSVLSVPTDLRVSYVSHSPKRALVCDDPFFLKQIVENVREKVLEQLELVCGDSLYCHIQDLEAICGDILNNHQVYSNNVYRKKRNVYTPYMYGDYEEERTAVQPSDPGSEKTLSMAVAAVDGDSRQIIDIVFKLIGQFRAELNTSLSQETLVEGVKVVQAEMEVAATSGSLDILIGQEMIVSESVQFSAPSFLCGTGTVLSGNTCVNCPIGTFFNVVTKSCSPCAAGSYQDNEAQVTCLVCPGGTFTRIESGATNSDYCKAQCLPGTISDDGLESCRTCEVGTFQSEYARTGCELCAPGSTTLQRGAVGPQHCKGLCRAGMSSETGVEPCYPCPRGFFQQYKGQTFCFKCPLQTETSFISTGSIDGCLGLDNPAHYDIDSLEKLAVNDCFSLPCLHQGTCLPLIQGFQCVCDAGYAGSFCEIELDHCESSPCFNLGICKSSGSNFECTCQPGYSGQQCQMDINECEHNQCQNNSTCSENNYEGGVKRYICQCQDGFQGEFCSENVDDCLNHGCENEGVCLDGLGTFSCQCREGFSGRLCEEEVDDCIGQPCGLGATCIDKINSYQCVCPPGARGPNCQELENLCNSDPCQSGSTCIPTLGHFICICPPAFSGKLCQTRILPNFVLEFGNSASTETLDYVLLEQIYSPLDQLTICLWMKSSDPDNYGTPFSYAVKDQDNELTVTDYSGFVLSVKGEKVVTDVTANDGKWHFICFSWESYTGSWMVYKDGALQDTGKGLAKGKFVDDGGLAVIGQEQDERGDAFSASESFRGSIARLDMWSKVLSPKEVEDIRLSCEPYYGDVIAWSDMYRGLKGEIRISDLEVCFNCPFPQDFHHGSIMVEGNGPSSVGMFECDEGYYLEGPPQLSCNIFGEWETEFPTCRLINCGYPGYIENGFLIGTSYLFGDSVMFSCDTGYNLEGFEQQTCLGNGSWSNTKPECKEIRCQVPKRFLNGNFTLESKDLISAKIEEKIIFECEDGFDLDGLESLECLEDGTWSDIPPICQPIPCTKPPIVPNGYIAGGQPESMKQGTLLTYNCDPGYEIVSVDKVLCGSRGQWIKPMPKCKTVLCQPPKNVANGRTSFGGTTFGEVVIYKCKKGHYLLGPLNSTCTEIGVWEPPAPKCVPVDCGEIKPFEHGSAQYENTTYKSIARYSCIDGFSIRGPTERHCTSSGHWSNKQPRCLSIKCEAPTDISLGRSTQNSSYTYGEEASFSCLPGHNLHQTSPLVCDLNGDWVGSFPYCVPSLCVGPASIPNGTILVASWTSEPLQEHAINLLKEEILQRKKSKKDFKLLRVDNSQRILESAGKDTVYYPVGSEVWFECLPGYHLEGSSTNICEDIDSWENPFPVCKEVVCPVIRSILNGKISVDGFKFNRHAIYTCNEGYSLVGDTVRNCMENGTWSGKIPECLPRLCSEPISIPNGQNKHSQSLEYGSVVTYSCNKGFKLIGGGERVCGHNSDWSGQPPVCANTTQTCLVPQLITSGYIAFDGNLEVGSMAWYDCNDEHELIGNSERICLGGGSWSGNDPLCNPKHCSSVTHLKNGRVKGNIFDLGSSLQFSCDSGYILNGKSAILCSDKGTWNYPLPVCVPTICPMPEPLENGHVRGSARRYDDSIVNECNSGYTLIGPKIRKCNLKGEWSGPDPHCASIICPEIQPIERGFSDFDIRVPGEKARFGCNLGWKLDGSTNITCSNKGSWEGEIPKCVRNKCILNEDMTNATLVGKKTGEYEIDSTLKWKCNSELKLRGEEKTTCLPNGEWDYEFPSCYVNECKDVFRLENGVIFGTKNTTQSLEVRFSCDNGYYKIMDSFLECEVDGRWKGNVPICSRKVCENEFVLENSVVSFKPAGSTYTAEFKCKEQYKLSGKPKIRCQKDNVWSSSQPLCELKHCKPIGTIPKMIYDKENFDISETVKFKCDSGYNLKGSEFVRCSESGVWEDSFPICVPLKCEITPRIKHGSWSLKHSQYKKSLWSKEKSLLRQDSNHLAMYVEDVLTVECDHGFDVYGETKLTCQPDQILSSNFPKCKPKHCRILTSIENGIVIHNGTYRGASATYKCDRGYQLVGNNLRNCKRNKNWSRDPPVCTPIKCKKPHNIAHGEIDFNPDDLQFRSKVKFYCHLGYELTGPDERKCGDDGFWIGEEPECILIRCSPPKIPLHGEQDIHDLTVGGSISYSCNHGFKLDGSKVLTCLNNKTWSGQVPACLKISCELPRNISNGIVNFSDMDYQANVEYMCNDGYSLIGFRTRSCLHSGRWNGKEPSCIPSLCHSLVVKDGWINAEGYTPGDKVLIGCDPGFQISGVSVLVCQINLIWTPSLPACVPLACGQPPLVANAVTQAQGFSYLNTVTYTCVPGFELRGSSKVICSEDANWKGDLPSCLPKPCGPPKKFPNMEVRFESKGGYDLGYGSKAMYICDQGFITEKENILTCNEDGNWHGEIHGCDKVPCGEPPHPANGSVSISHRNFKYTAKFSCNPGFSPTGRSSILCKEDRSWEFVMVECNPVECGQPVSLINGKLIGDRTTFGEIVKLKCNEGFIAGKNDTLRCSENGDWAGGELSCSLAQCSALSNLTHGHIAYDIPHMYTSAEYSYPLGSVARFVCGEGYTLFGSEKLLCMQNQTWSGEFPHCQRVWCGGVDPPKHGFMMGVGKQWRDIIRFSCEEGYRMFGSSEIECLHTGTWSSPPPSCHRVWCEVPVAGSGQLLPTSLAGSVNLPSTSLQPSFPHRSRIQLTCRAGHRQRGDLSIQCQPNGRWTRPEGACHRISCGRPEVEAGATLLSQTFVFGSRVPYSCPSGEYPVNSPLHCQADGSWSSKPGRCFRVNK